jgi:restriction endonuclease S subunit
VNISQAIVKKIMFPLPPLETQLEISQQAANYDKVLDKVEATLKLEKSIKEDLLKTLVA